MGSMQRELRPSIQREDKPTMEKKLEQIAVKAVNEQFSWALSQCHRHEVPLSFRLQRQGCTRFDRDGEKRVSAIIAARLY
jgi:hypothetical protein